MDWAYDSWKPTSGGWRDNELHEHPDEQDPHLDLGCGTVKKGRIGVDRFAAPGVNVVMDLDRGVVHSMATEPNTDAVAPVVGRWAFLSPGLPFEDSSIESIISHHCFEHISDGFIPLVDECYRVLKPGGVLRAITPFFPSYGAVSDPDHKRYFCEDTWVAFTGHLGSEDNPTGSWQDSFSVPYTKARFQITDTLIRDVKDDVWASDSRPEIRVSLQAVK